MAYARFESMIVMSMKDELMIELTGAYNGALKVR